MTYDARSDFVLVLAATDGAGAFLGQPAAPPTCRVYGNNGFVGAVTTAAFQQAAVTDAQPQGGSTRLTAAAHPFRVGDQVVVSGVLGATGANGTFAVAAVTTDTLDIAVAPGGSYSGGGAVVSRGLYAAVATADLRSLLEPGRAYTAVWRFAVGATPYVVAQPFTVV